MLAALALAAVCLSPPVGGPAIAGYSPTGTYGGHWGVDYAAAGGEVVTASATGRVSFAGTVAGMMTVTVEPVSGLKVSTSFLSRIDVITGQLVARGDALGVVGTPHGRSGVHLSVRIDGRYVDPQEQMGCRSTDISRALWLVTPPSPYPRRRADGNSRRNIRPDSRRPFARRRGRHGPGRPRPGSFHTCR